MGGERLWERRRSVQLAASDRDGVISRADLRDLGVDRHSVAREVAAGRWRLHGRVTVAVHTGSLSRTAWWWRAVWEVGHGAALDGISALHAAGLENFTSDEVHVAVPHPAVPRPVDGVVLHRIRDLDLDRDAVGAGLPRVRSEVATIRAAQWAVSDRQAALIVCMAVQQRLVRAEQLCPVRHPGAHYGRTRFVRRLVRDVADGAQSLGELDFARLCRERGLPVPSRQVVRRGHRGRLYLDVAWEDHGVVVEIDGAQHRQGLAVTSDNLRRNSLTLGDDIVLTIDLIGLRLEEDLFMAQVGQALRRAA
ncbi:hypothetical protein ASC58_18230 [Phycicoccus sp. Root101]|nr:hypothetical protein ASC58_18230 [Phycicoccus sp. Root101]